MAKDKMPMLDGEGSPLEESEKAFAKMNRERMKERVKLEAERIKAERDRRRKGK